jgi:hypothetical protein
MSNGGTKVFYDPMMIPGGARKGAVLSAQRAPKRLKDPSDYTTNAIGEIYVPLALPMYRTELDPNKKRRAELKDPFIAKIPEKPSQQGPNTSFFFTNYVMSSRIVDNSRAQDHPNQFFFVVF